MARRILLPVLSALSLLPACSGPSLLNALVPRNGYQVTRDLAYGEGPRRVLDLYVPNAPRTGTPLIVFFYGGRWDSGTKDWYPFVAQALATRGYATAILDYRVYPEVRYPAFLEDGAAAVAWLAAYRRDAGLGAGPIYLMGHSAGAHIAAMLALDARWLDGAGIDRCRTIAGMIGLAGPYDFLPLSDPRLMEVFGPGPAGADTQPITHVTSAAPPLLLIAGSADETVLPRNTTRLAARIRASGGTVEERILDGKGHVGVILTLAPLLRGRSPVLDDIDRFLAANPAPRC